MIDFEKAKLNVNTICLEFKDIYKRVYANELLLELHEHRFYMDNLFTYCGYSKLINCSVDFLLGRTSCLNVASNIKTNIKLTNILEQPSYTALMAALADNIEHIILQKNMTNKEFSTQAGFVFNIIDSIRQGQENLFVYDIIAEVLGVSFSYMFGITNNPYIEQVSLLSDVIHRYQNDIDELNDFLIEAKMDIYERMDIYSDKFKISLYGINCDGDAWESFLKERC